MIIQQERKEHYVLNSTQDLSTIAVPCQESEHSQEIEEEKKQEEKLEQMIRTIRKERKKLRLHPVKDVDQGTKRRKIKI